MELNLSNKYLRFLVNNVDSRHVIIQGSRRSGKSFSVYKWLAFLASGNEPLTIYVITASYPALQLAIDDFTRATSLTVQGNQIIGLNCQMANGSRFVFKSFDDPTKAQGTSCDIVYFEEALNISEKIITTFAMGVRKQMYFCYNPTKKSFLDKYIDKNKSNYLLTTYKDNNWLTPEQIQEFIDMERRGKAPNATLYDIFAYKVYCLGEFNQMVGRAFEKLEYCTYEDYLAIPAKEQLACDVSFGGVDKTALVGCKLYMNRLYVHTYAYQKGTLNAKDFAWMLVRCGINSYTNVIVDYGGVSRMIMDDVITAGNGTWTEPELRLGFSLINVIKKPVMESMAMMMGLDAIVIDDSNLEVREEFENVELTDDGKVKGTDHAVDAARYAATYLKLTS